MNKLWVLPLLFLVSASAFAGGQTEGAAAAVEKATVSMWIYDEMASAPEKAMVKAAADFQAANPNIVIAYENVPNRGLKDKFIAASATGKVPDVVHVSLDWAVELGAMGHTEPLDAYLGDKLKDLPKGALESSSYRGKIYAVPWYVDTTVIYYNKDMFKAAALALPGKEPMNWDELLAAAKKLTVDLNSDGTPDQYGFATRKGRGASITWFPFFYSNNGKLYSDDGLSPAINSREGHESFQYLTDMYTKHKVMPPASVSYDTWDDIRNAFIAKKMAMYTTGNWEIGPMTKGAQFEWSVAPHPKQQARSSFLGGASFVIPAKAANKKAAWKWIDFLTDAGSMKYLAEYDRIPARNDSYNADHIKANPLYDYFAREIPAAKSHASIYADRIRTEVGVAFDEAMLGKKDAKSALDDAAARVKKEMRPDMPGM